MVLDWIPAGSQPLPDPESASPALLRRRALAVCIDLLICYFVIEAAILAVLMVVFLDFFVSNGALAFALSIVGLVPVYLLYSFLYEWRYARTPGKQRMGLLVSMDDGSYPCVRAAAVRNVLRYVDWLPILYGVGWLLARRSPEGKRLGDRIASTLVVRPETTAEPILSESTAHTDCLRNSPVPGERSRDTTEERAQRHPTDDDNRHQ